MHTPVLLFGVLIFCSVVNNDGGANLGEFAATDRVMRPIEGFTRWLTSIYIYLKGKKNKTKKTSADIQIKG